MAYGAGARMAAKSAYMVFVLPVAVSVPAAAFVMAGLADDGAQAFESVRLVGLEGAHPSSEPLSVSAAADPAFDCGDFYIAVFGPGGELVAQEAYFEQCFAEEGLEVPVDGEFSLMLEAGQYRVSVDVIDAAGEGTATAAATVTVG